MAYCLHIGCPGTLAIPGLADHARTFASAQAATALGAEWTVRVVEYDQRAHVDARQFVGAVLATPGPALLLRPIQSDALSEITRRLEGRQLVMPAEAYDAGTLATAIAELKRLHDIGEPLLPLKRVVALMIVAKLDHLHMWGGNDKGYLWSDWIPKGRGIDEEFKPLIAELVFLLHQHAVLINKTSNSKKKYALNPDKRVEIGNICRSRRFSQELERVFARDGATISARQLDFLDKYDAE